MKGRVVWPVWLMLNVFGAGPSLLGSEKTGSEATWILDLLERKGLITRDEAEQTRAELQRRREITWEEYTRRSKWQVSRWVERMDFHGDARLRFEHRSGEDGLQSGDDRQELNRWRYRLRAGVRMEFSDQLRAGIQLQSGTSGRSGNVTFGGDAGPWGRDSDGLYVNQLYVQWTPLEWLALTGGRQPSPFEITWLVWDPDLQPEGLSEQLRYKWGSWEVALTFGQFLYDDANPDNPFGTGPGDADAYLFVQQVAVRYGFNRHCSASVAPLLHVYTGAGDSYGGPFGGSTRANSLGINDLMVLEVPWEVRYTGRPFPVRVFGDFALNLRGEDRARAAGTPRFDEEHTAWMAGLELGNARGKGGWRVRAAWHSVGLYALDPNLMDTDVFDSRLNLQGLVLSGTYLFTDFCDLTLTYARADQRRASLPTGASGDLGGALGTARLDDYQLFQADISLRF
ncbi:MAG: putative porin [Verrucomicrobiota bacterium]|nr:putative porin [Limisphaera sp.]MDW8380623.1 putative porin [Verrucomicrobiota bacterium]